MEPFKAFSLVVAAGVVSLVGAGAAGFYAGYSAGRGDLSEIKEHLSAGAPVVSLPAGGDGQPAVQLNMKPVLEEVRAVSQQLQGLQAKVEAKEPAAMPNYGDEMDDLREAVNGLASLIENKEPQAPEAVLQEIRKLNAAVQSQEPKAPQTLLDELKALTATVSAVQANPSKKVLDELRFLGDQIQALAKRPAAAATTEAVKAEPANKAEINDLRQLVALAAESFNRCQSQLATITTAAFQPQASASETAPKEPANVVLYDNLVLKRDEEKLYNDIGMRLSLQGIGARQVKLAVNRQDFGLSFGERKVFRVQDIECELNLMETNLNNGEARVSIACKR